MKGPAAILDRSLKVAVACGGTGGHLFPGVAVADEFRRLGHTPFLLLSDKQVDLQAAKTLEHPHAHLSSVAWQRGSRLGFLTGFMRGLRETASIFKVRQPDAVLAMGGFTSLCPVFIARLRRRPVFLHESNSMPGRAVRILARWANKGFVGFEKASRRLSGLQCFPTGTPVRSSLRQLDRQTCCKELGFDPRRPVLLVTGGSQGALGLNRCMTNSLAAIGRSLPELQILHLVGLNDDIDKIRTCYRHAGVQCLLYPFFKRMDLALGAADAAVGRAGASFMAELAAVRLPSLLIPFPHSAENHQRENALTFADQGAALHVDESEATPICVVSALKTLIQEEDTRVKMKSALAALDYPDAAEKIVSRMLSEMDWREGLVPARAASRTSRPSDHEAMKPLSLQWF
ncbi:MAG: UDP-N-acetylglucosamine--N-acetylmuramyl-(pentapeptide) pyrophosphoryl-undecaprenol N-acetylglucosamine transferase [Verrucomicrobiota bacterium]|jgi:UDP-N-acetylglucosamine--N-acetylmuramyl-(pentapeptide) pyrophosphoryl-undecaprenol N-acetylglucosamine transferase|nr:UDP-N-acetylglucosamine--N-acetylmuramyl-(pentapeptide) pyrophosphoryl-undecaprenol N-acetylglucosamine transferase [Verrucomicrobiota bacterium]